MPSRDAGGPVLRIDGLVKTFNAVRAVDGLQLEVMAGECFGLLGPNGAGKTTTIEICEGLTRPDSGVVEVLGMGWETHRRQLRERLGIQLQDTQLADKLTVLETIQLFRSFFTRGLAPDEAIGVVQLDEKRHARVRTLSGGQKQRLALACSLVGDPDLLFLDEPTTGLDPQARRQLWDVIEDFKKRGRTIVLTTHYMDEAERLSDRIAIMDHGTIIARGTPRGLIASIGAEHMLEVSTNARSLDARWFGEIPGARDVHVEGGAVAMQVSELHQAVPAVLAAVDRRGLELTELRTRSATLEDVFVALTGRHLRDD